MEFRRVLFRSRRDGLPDLPLEQCTALPDGVLLARLVAIGALANNMVEARGSGRIWMERLVLGAKTPREAQTQSAEHQFDPSRTEDLPSIPQANHDSPDRPATHHQRPPP